jgi:hypothetical protein
MAPRRQRRSRPSPKAPTRAAPSISPHFSWREKLLLAIGLGLAYAVIGTWGRLDFSDLMGYYNLQADAFLAGRLHVIPTSTLQDLVPFANKYYLQWGPFPAVLHAAANLFDVVLSDRVACLLAGWLSALVFFEIIITLRRLWFPVASKGLCVWFVLAFAFGTPSAMLAWYASIYHESISIAMLLMLASLLFFLRYLEQGIGWWLVAAGLAAGLSLTTRVTYALHGGALLAGLCAFQQSRRLPLRRRLRQLAALGLPLVACGLLMAAYNQARFASPLDFGMTHLFGPKAPRMTKLARIPENFLHYVVSAPHLSSDFPWIIHEGWQPRRATKRADNMSSLLLASPFLFLAGITAWRLSRRDTSFVPAWVFLGTVALSGGTAFLFLLTFVAAARRYGQDFLPQFMILAFAGSCALPTGTRWRRWRAAAWPVLCFSAFFHLHLAFTASVRATFPDPNTMKAFVAIGPTLRRLVPGPRLIEAEAMTLNDLGVIAMRQRRFSEALHRFEQAAALMSESPRISENLRLARQLVGSR